MRIWLSLALFLAAAPGIIRAQCAPSAAVQTAIDELPAQSADETDWAFEQKHDAAIQALRQRFPGDVFVERTYIQSKYRQADRDKVMAEFKALHEKSPDNPVLTYLYATSLEGHDSPQSIKLFEAALAHSPQFPWPHSGLAQIYSMPVFLNQAEALKHTKAFLAACPDAFDGYASLSKVDDKAVLAGYAAKLRALLDGRTDDKAIGAYRTLWSIEFKAHPASEYDALRKQVSEDLKQLRALKREDKRVWYYTLEEGYKLANDRKEADSISDERQRRLPQSWELAAMSKWDKDHPRPNMDDPAANKREHYAALLDQTSLWLKERPKMEGIWQSRLSAMEYLDNIPDAEVIATADTYLKLATDNAGPEGPYYYTYFSIARALARRHLQPEHVVDLLKKNLAGLKKDSAEPMHDGYATKENLEDNNFYNTQNRVNPLGYEAAAYIDLKDAGKARLTLTRMEDALEALKPFAAAKDEYKKAYTTRLAFWWELMAREAELEGHDQDAMAFYERALLSRFEAKTPPETGLKDEMADGARRLWAKLGGSNDGWQLWYGRQADILATQAGLSWEDASMPLPAFQLTDLKGKTWTEASLKGKTTFLNFWASW